MEIQNELRRAKQKLKLFDQEALNWVLFDLIDLIDKDIGEKDDPVPEEEKIKFVDKLKKSYQKYIKDNTPTDPKQVKLFKDGKC